MIRKEKASGTTTKGRAELAAILDLIREGDTLVVTRIDRLARSIADLQDIVRTLKARGDALRATEQPIDTRTAAGKCFLDMLGVFAEFETNLRRERQLEGIAKAKAAGVYKGRKPSIDVAKVEALKASGLGPTEIARQLKIGRASVYRLVAQSAGQSGRVDICDRCHRCRAQRPALSRRGCGAHRSGSPGGPAWTDPMPSIAAACRQFRFQDRPLLLLSKRPSVRASIYALTTIRSVQRASLAHTPLKVSSRMTMTKPAGLKMCFAGRAGGCDRPVGRSVSMLSQPQSSRDAGEPVLLLRILRLDFPHRHTRRTEDTNGRTNRDGSDWRYPP
jgi:DNA invertase Pin-like site-specific DNA recombinase